MQMKYLDSFNVISSFSLNGKTIYYFNIEKLEDIGLGKIRKFPFSIKILLEAVLRQIDNRTITTEDVELILKWTPTSDLKKEIPFIPNRIILQDFTGVPAVVDLAAMRSAIKRLGGNPSDINPIIPADLIIDHSIQVNYFGTSNSCELNEKLEFERNIERYKLLRWAQESFSNFRVVPPGNGIIHQINLEYLATVVQEKKIGNKIYAYPDTVLGTDSHTTMINGLGVVGWGVGGIEAEAVMLGQPYYMPVPKVVGVKLFGEINENITATDIVLTITEKLRKHGVVGKFIEFYGPSLADLSLPDRVTISNMCPEYGGTIGFFPIDEKTLDYLLLSGRDSDHVRLIEKYAKLLGIFLDEDGEIPDYSEKLEIDLSSIEPCLAGPRRPQDRVPMKKIQKSFHSSLISLFGKKVSNNSEIPKTDVLDIGNSSDNLKHGSVVIAAITSCTNTSNPYVLIGAGLLAKNAVEKGLRTKPYVKTSIAPGSKVVTEYLKKSGLLKYLEQLG
ncbi:MAG: aconitate hydratase AcnA, partial [Candidatus Helarchaeota archaeon]